MKVKDLKYYLDTITKDSAIHDDDEVCVKIKKTGTAGGTPTVEVTSASFGFDFDRGKLVFTTKPKVKEANE